MAIFSALEWVSTIDLFDLISYCMFFSNNCSQRFIMVYHVYFSYMFQTKICYCIVLYFKSTSSVTQVCDGP